MIRKVSYDVEIEALSPVFIGSGIKISRLEYCKRKNHIEIFDFNKLIDFCFENNIIEDLYNLVSKKENGGHFLNQFDTIIKNLSNKVSSLKKDDFLIKRVEADTDIFNQRPQIELFMHNANGDTFIPGSSLKGAIRTALIASKINEGIIDLNAEKREFSRQVNSYFSGIDRDSNKRREDDENFSVSDSPPFNSEAIRILSGKRLMKRGGKHTPNSLGFVESLKQGQKTNTTFNVESEELIEKIIKSSKKFYQKAIEEKINSLDHIKGIKEADNLYDNLHDIEDLIKDNTDESTFFLCVGKHKGYFENSIGALLLDEMGEEEFYKWRKSNNIGKAPRGKPGSVSRNFPATFSFSGDGAPFGWCRLTVRKR